MRWRMLRFAATLAVLAGAGCAATGKVDESQQSYQFAGPIAALKVDAHAASVTIVAADGPAKVTETLRFTGDKPATSHGLDGSTVLLTESGCSGANLRCDVEYQISVPAQTSAQVTTQAGQVTVDGLAGALNVTSDAGSVTGKGLSSARTTVTTKAGFVKLVYQSAPDDVTVSTDAGAIELKVPGDVSYAVEIAKGLGVDNVTVPRDPNSLRKISTRTNLGAVTVTPN
jgi:outer membrane murein-binding lipoprotein Lpp